MTTMACHRTGLSRFAPPRSIWGANTLLQLLNDDLGTSARTTPNQAKITVPCLKKKNHGRHVCFHSYSLEGCFSPPSVCFPGGIIMGIISVLKETPYEIPACVKITSFPPKQFRIIGYVFKEGSYGSKVFKTFRHANGLS